MVVMAEASHSGRLGSGDHRHRQGMRLGGGGRFPGRARSGRADRGGAHAAWPRGRRLAGHRAAGRGPGDRAGGTPHRPLRARGTAAAGSFRLWPGRPGLRVSRGGTRAVDAGAGCSTCRPHRARARDRLFQLHVVVHGRRHRRAAVQGDGGLPRPDPARCYPDRIGGARVRTFLPPLPRWFPFREAVRMAATSLLMPLYAWRFRGVDAIVGCNQPSAWIAWWAARLMDVPYVVYLNQPNRLVYPRNIDRQTGWVSNADYRLLAAIVLRATSFVAWADRRSIQEANQLLVNGNYIGDIIRKTYRRDAVDCPAGCHVASSGFPLPIESRFGGGLTVNGYPIRRPYVLLTNRHYPQKRFDLAIRAIAEVRRQHPRVQLLIPGPATSHTASLKSLVGELGLEDGVVFLGPITEDELQSLYEGAAVYVYPAPEEDFGMGVIDSMAKGVPVVAWNQAGPTVTVGPGTGHLAEPLEVSDYAAGIISLLDDPGANQVSGERAFEWARRFDWERHIDVLERSVLDVARSHEQVAAEAATA